LAFFFRGWRIKLPGIEARERENCTSAWWELERYFTLLELEPKLFIYAPNCGRIMAAVRFQRSTRESPPPLHQNSSAQPQGEINLENLVQRIQRQAYFSYTNLLPTTTNQLECQLETAVREGLRCKFIKKKNIRNLENTTD
jgi:hypothetical protein